LFYARYGSPQEQARAGLGHAQNLAGLSQVHAFEQMELQGKSLPACEAAKVVVQLVAVIQGPSRMAAKCFRKPLGADFAERDGPIRRATTRAKGSGCPVGIAQTVEDRALNPSACERRKRYASRFVIALGCLE
jgi:hypothetical protein